jgi:hypothetical protein
MATNKSPWLLNLGGADKPLLLPGKVQAGTSQAIKAGEICTYNETSGYFVPVDAVADQAYSLAIAAEEQKAADLARYMDFIMLRPDDVFEFALAAAASIALGDALTLTASQSQQLTRDVDGTVVATSVNVDNYPQTGTTLRSKSYAQVIFHPQFSYYCKNIMQLNLKKVITTAAAYTLKLEDCGAIISTKGDADGVALTAPEAVVPVGWFVDVFCGADTAVSFDPKPDTAKVYIKGAAQAAGKYVSVTDIGDYLRLVWDGTDWLAMFSVSGADADISVEG